MKLPTDREILEAIYKRYCGTFAGFAKEGGDKRTTKVYVPVDLQAIADSFKVDGDIIFAGCITTLKTSMDTNARMAHESIFLPHSRCANATPFTSPCCRRS